MNNGFTPMIDKPKDEDQKLFEYWSKLVTPSTDQETPFTGDPYLYHSAADSYLFLDVAQEEIFRRLTNRKLDPTTGTIYHLEDNPPPEGDPKLKDRLQDYQGDAEQADHARLQASHSAYEANAW